MEPIVNLFTDGVITDSHPLTTSNNVLTDALNATFRTYNGNELMLQNDMGNSKILDSTTGNIMGLDDGFVPIGMKEYGGILYIASYNKETNEGLLGTIPSPVLNYTYSSGNTTASLDLTFENDIANLYQNSLLYKHEEFLISSLRFCPGDLFIINLNIEGFTNKIYRNVYYDADGFLSNLVIDNPEVIIPIDIGTNIPKKSALPTFNLGISNLLKFTTEQFNKVSGFDTDSDDVLYGLFKLNLVAKVEKSTESLVLKSVTSKNQKYYKEDGTSSFDEHWANYWFIPDTVILDEELCQADDCYRAYPNILPGYLYCSIEPELIEDVDLFENKSTPGIKSPITYIITEK